MEGYEVLTSDDDTVGHVVERQGDNLIVEHGHLRKSKHVIPCSTVEIDDAEEKVRTSLSKELILSSPKVNGSLDEEAIAAHYGIGSTAERETAAAGLETSPEERARAQKGDPASGLPDESPALLGDRVSGIDEREQRD
jgi:hypothetical protein